VRSTVSQLVQKAGDEKAHELARARTLVEHAKQVQSPRILESQRHLLDEKKLTARGVREEVEQYHSMGEAFGAQEVERKKVLVGKIQIEIGADALNASKTVVVDERFEIRDAVRAILRDGSESIAKEKDEVRTERLKTRSSIEQFKKGAKNARNALSSRRKEAADSMRGQASTIRERKTTLVQETERLKRQFRDAVLEDRSPPSQTLPPATPATPANALVASSRKAGRRGRATGRQSL